ncbi:MAG: ATP-binding protein, partial [Nitrosopumilus sp.]
MKFSKFDIGGEIISILTRGMYPDPKDAIREYIQNGIDAQSTKIFVKVGQDSVIIKDVGNGMDQKTMRNALRVGVSDKIPSKDVGFMGIGIYSSFHLCDTLTIYSKKGISPNKLEIDFRGMRELLEQEKELRLNSQIESDEITDLQSLLEKHIYVSNDGDLKMEDYPLEGTRVEMTGISPVFYSELSDFNKLATYIQEVIPLRFDSENFMWGKIIEDHIATICSDHNAKFELVDINLQVHNKSKDLFKPYHNDDFSNSKPLEPIFQEIKDRNLFFGVAWGCLNSIRRKISKRHLRGFLLKKQGFALGKRENLVKYFPRANAYFDRYIGEIVVVHNELLPNASRSDLEYSGMRTLFYD